MEKGAVATSAKRLTTLSSSRSPSAKTLAAPPSPSPLPSPSVSAAEGDNSQPAGGGRARARAPPLWVAPVATVRQPRPACSTMSACRDRQSPGIVSRGVGSKGRASGGPHAAPAGVAREGGALNRREALPVGEPDARPQVADQLRQRLRVGILTLAAVGFTKEVDRGAGGDAEHLLSGHGHAKPVADGLGGAFDPVERAVHQVGERRDRPKSCLAAVVRQHDLSFRPHNSESYM
eukprot:scaffold64808_cov64-Phaeocystis_antarctica.AAC.3